MRVEVKGEQGLGELAEEGLEDDSRQVQLVVLLEVHRQPWRREGGARSPAANPGRPLDHKPRLPRDRGTGPAVCRVGPLNTHHGRSSPPSRNLI